MNTFKLGCNLDFALIDVIDQLNKKYENKITEVFGSIRKHHKFAARPAFRLPDMDEGDFAEYVFQLRNIGVDFNYTLNASAFGSLSNVSELYPELHGIMQFLYKTCGVRRYTVTSPLVAQMIRQLYPEIELELSTIAHLNQVTQLRAYHDLCGFTRFCVGLDVYRDFKMLKAIGDVATENKYTINLMVNEFCSTSEIGYSCHCIYRQDCYNFHSFNKTKVESMMFDNYPMSKCMCGRGIEPYSWLRSRFILPQWLKYYNDVGITHFKITGRTGSTAYIKKIAEAYMAGRWDGNLLELWKQLDTIYDSSKDDNAEQSTNLSSKIIDDKFFINHWIEDRNFNCAYESCGKTCRYCEEFYEKHLKK